VKQAGVEYFYFLAPYPNIRCKADMASLRDLSSYEVFTCLTPGAKYEKSKPQLDRDAHGKLIYGWKKKTGLVGMSEQRELEKSGAIKPGEGWWQCRDAAENGKRVEIAGGSVYWNDYRKKYLSIFGQWMGSSLLGEIFYAEADAPEGPWKSARKIVTHDNYSFYNPKQDAFLDQEGGRIIYFEGTYTATFTNNQNRTPRYEYNQVMYRLDLSDARLNLER